MQPNVKNLKLIDLGHEVRAEADFMEHHIEVRCVYDSERQCWVFHVFLIDDTGPRCITEVPSALYSSSRLGAVHRGLIFAKRTIREANPAANAADEANLPNVFQKMASAFNLMKARIGLSKCNLTERILNTDVAWTSDTAPR